LFDAVVAGYYYRECAIIVLLGITWRLCRRRWSVSSNFGTARMAGWFDLRRGKVLSKKGLGSVSH
jgi:hypothetical protein